MYDGGREKWNYANKGKVKSEEHTRRLQKHSQNPSMYVHGAHVCACEKH